MARLLGGVVPWLLDGWMAGPEIAGLVEPQWNLKQYSTVRNGDFSYAACENLTISSEVRLSSDAGFITGFPV